MKKTTVTAGIIGSGRIAQVYARNIGHYPHVTLGGFQDIDPARAEKSAKDFGVKAYKTLEEMLADPEIDLAVVLTFQSTHAAIIRQCIEAGKHVFTEKPLATTYADARMLADLATERGVRVCSAPITYMGEAQESVWRLIREKKIGPIRMVYSDVNCGRLEKSHPNPVPFCDVGPLWDVGIYPITLLTAFFGPVRRVTGIGKFIYPERTTLAGESFTVKAPDFMLVLIEMANGTLARLTVNFCFQSRQALNVEFLGDEGRIWLENFQDFAAPVELTLANQPMEKIDPGVPRELIPSYGRAGRGVDEIARAILDGRPHRGDTSHAAHVIEVLEAIERSEGKPIEIHSSFNPPQPVASNEVTRFKE